MRKLRLFFLLLTFVFTTSSFGLTIQQRSRYYFSEVTPSVSEFLLLENGDFLLLENGDKLILE